LERDLWGITTNTIKGGSLEWPTIVDLLDLYKVTWKCYNLGSGTGSQINVLAGFNALAFFSKWQHDRRLYFKEADYYHDLQSGTLPHVAFLITEFPMSEHPPNDIYLGQRAMAKVIQALMHSPGAPMGEGGSFNEPLQMPIGQVVRQWAVQRGLLFPEQGPFAFFW
jgi:phospholipase C